MKLLVFLNALGLGGTEKAALRWAGGLGERGHHLQIVSLADGLRRAQFEQLGLPVQTVGSSAQAIAQAIEKAAPDVIHAHAPGQPHPGDVLGQALARLPKVPLVQTNIFGRLENPAEDAWTDFRLFISWTSCVQAARRAFRRLDAGFFKRASVAIYPLDPMEPPPVAEIRGFRERLGIAQGQVLFGRLSRPEPNKWDDLALNAFRLASRRNSSLVLLLREPPPAIAEQLRSASDCDGFRILPATADAEELRLTMAALDVVLHTSALGESFGYGIAEPMNFGKPVITHSVPWEDQAQIELVRHGECGFVASTPARMADAILGLASSPELREQMGRAAQAHIRKVASPEVSITRLECALRAAVERRDNPLATEDLRSAQQAAAYLDAHQLGHSFREKRALLPYHLRVRFHQWRRAQQQKAESEKAKSGNAE